MPAAAIECHQLTKCYGATIALDSLDLEVRAGEVLGFLGPNGAGKTTTIRTLLDLLHPTSGRASILGLDTRRNGIEIRRRVGYLPGELVLPRRLTGNEYLDYLSALCGQRHHGGRELAERFALDLTRPMRALSKGNRQKLGLVQAFMHDPEVLVLDEPTSGLDPLVQQEFHELLHDTTARGRTVFLSSHVLSEVQHIADRVAILRAGKLVVVEDVDSIRAKALRRVEISFAGPAPDAEFASLPGVISSEVIGDRVNLEVQGELDPVVKAAARHHVVDIDSREADLDEVFLAYYREEVPQ
ncbi:MAG: ABC transporter ATP-binding protein [Acidimicrobiia bacterium]